MTAELNSREFRTALGAFATGVTIVTTRGPDGAAIGLTANSFNSLSLDPPLVLWALAKSSRSLPAFAAAEHFAVHVLAATQQSLSDLFARKGADKFGQIECDVGLSGIPLLRGCAARFQCRTEHQYEGGDHYIFVGRVLSFDHFDRRALAFQKGQYGSVLRHAKVPVVTTPADTSSFSSDFLGYLLARAHASLMARVSRELQRYRLAEEHYQVLMFLSATDDRTLAELDRLARLADRTVTYQTLADLSVLGLVTVGGADDPSTRARLTEEGHRTVIEIASALKAAEADTEECLGFDEAHTLKSWLRAIIVEAEKAPRTARLED